MEAELLAQQTGKMFWGRRERRDGEVDFISCLNSSAFPFFSDAQREPNVPTALMEDIKGRRVWLETRINRVLYVAIELEAVLGMPNSTLRLQQVSQLGVILSGKSHWTH